MTLTYNKFNRGEIDDLALARDDVTRVINSAALMNNFVPMRLGPMMYRPGMEYKGVVKSNDMYLVPFVASLTSTAILEFTNQCLRIWTDDQLVQSSSVTSTITNGDFVSNITGWTDASEVGAITNHDSVDEAASLLGTQTARAILYQTISPTDTDEEHTMVVEVGEAPVTCLVGTSGVSSDDIFSEVLAPGVHSLVFTPNNDITITFENSANIRALVKSVSFSGTGAVELPTDIDTTQLPTIRTTQSADVIFLAYDNGLQLRIERRGVKSWSIVEYRPNDGPFGFINNSDITLTASALSGNASLTANKAFFTPESVGTLYKLASAGQNVTASVTAEDSGTGSIRVTGVSTAREFTISVSGLSGTGSTVTLQRSTDDVSWTDVESYTSNQSKTYNDELDNAILFYRLYVKVGDYSSGTIDLGLVYAGGSIEGICRVTRYINNTLVSVQILTPFGSTEATRDWYEGQWSQTAGYPSSTALYEGRLWWAGKTKLWGSVSDDFSSFTDELEGANNSIARTIGFGPVDTVNWLAISSRLIMGIATDEISVRSSSFGEVLTSTNTNLKSGSSQGVAPIEPVRIDDDIMFTQRSGVKINNLTYTSDRDTHKSVDLMMLNGSIADAGVKRLAVARQPETRMFVVLNDGTGLVYTSDESEDVKAWSRFDTDGTVLDVVVLPSLGEDSVYFAIQRTGGVYLEKAAQYKDATQKHLDSFVEYSSPGTTITGLSHLNGKTVHVWADNQKRGSYTVAGGQISVTGAWNDVVVGLQYIADYKSNKLSRYVDYSVLTLRKRVQKIGLITRDMLTSALLFGPDESNLKPLPSQEDGKAVDPDVLVEEYDHPDFPFNGSFKTDSRVHIRATGPCIIMALVFDVAEAKNKSAN